MDSINIQDREDGDVCDWVQEGQGENDIAHGEEYDEDEDYDDEDDSMLLPRALYVDGEPDFASAIPVDGAEYLRRVRWEAARYPDVVRADIDPRKFENKQTKYAQTLPDLMQPPPCALPSPEWLSDFISEFASVRARVASLREAPEGALPAAASVPRGSEARRAFCLGGGAGSAGHAPLLGLVLGLDNTVTADLLEDCAEWLESAPAVSERLAQWVFALAASVELPLAPDTAAVFRAMLRRCCALRALKTEAVDEELPALNVIIAIAGDVFRQAG